MVGYPYTKYTVAVMDVDMAAALVVATHARGRRARHPGRPARLPPGLVRTRPIPCSSPRTPTCGAHRRWPPRAPRRCAAPGAGIDDIAYLDLYSCFASSLHFACDALGIAPTDPRGLTVTGGLPYHGGPASGYLTHSIAAMVERLRADPGALGLVSGVGMHMTKHVFGVYSGRNRATVGPPDAIAPPDAAPVVRRARRATATVVALLGRTRPRRRTGRALLGVRRRGTGTRTYAKLRRPRFLRARRGRGARRGARPPRAAGRRRARWATASSTSRPGEAGW